MTSISDNEMTKKKKEKRNDILIPFCNVRYLNGNLSKKEALTEKKSKYLGNNNIGLF